MMLVLEVGSREARRKVVAELALNCEDGMLAS